MNRLPLTAWLPGRSRARRLRAGALAVVGAVVLTGVLAGCEPAQPGAAAIVGDQRLSVSTVQQRVREVAKTRGEALSVRQGDLQRLVVRTFVIGELIRALAEQQGAQVSNAQVEAALGGAATDPKQMAQLEQQAAQQGGVPKSQIRTVIRMRLLEQAVLQRLVGSAQPTQEQLTSKYVPALAAEAKKLRVQINPRYGTWDPKALDITAPAGSATPGP